MMMLRIQKERMGSDLFPSDREYHRQFGLTRARLRNARPNVIVMHPGPINREVEITPDVADGQTQSSWTKLRTGRCAHGGALCPGPRTGGTKWYKPKHKTCYPRWARSGGLASDAAVANVLIQDGKVFGVTNDVPVSGPTLTR